MRNQQTWDKMIRGQLIQVLFPPRIQKILMEFPSPKFEETLQSSFIYGNTQHGKTILSAQMMLEERRRMYLHPENYYGKISTTIFISSFEMFSNIKSSFDHVNSDVTERAIIEKYSQAHMLVIDDLGTVNPTTYVLQVLYGIINNRYENEKLTVITSNYEINELGKQFGDVRIVSRISQMCVLINKEPYNSTK